MFEDFYKDKDLIDFSNYLKESNKNQENQDETCVVPIKSLLVLKWKIYSYISKDGHECKRAKSNKIINNNKKVNKSDVKVVNVKKVLMFMVIKVSER